MTICSKSYLALKLRRGLTLVEMLVGMAITLVMMAAVVNLFANISEGVRNRRATMEVSATLRIARAQLYKDLAGATCLKYPKDAFGVMPKPDVNNPPDGYFEYVEGPRSDENPGVAGSIDPATSLVPSTNLPFNEKGEPLDPNIVTDGGGRGDYDDILAMTVESKTERFRGKGRGLRAGGNPTVIVPTSPDDPGPTGAWVDMAISSPQAEVVWFAVETPPRTSPDYRPEMGEPGMRKIYRRTLLIAPWYGTETRNYGGGAVTGSDPLLDLTDDTRFPTFASRMKYLRDFQNRYDISVRLENQRLVPNTLADLARREFRFAHMTNPSNYPGIPPTGSIGFYPYRFPYETDGVPLTGFYRQAGDTNSSLYPLGSENQPGDLPTSERMGEDLILSDVLAFDVQVYDPGAPLFLTNYSGTAANPVGGTLVQPSGTNGSGFRNAISTGTGIITGFGTYADLGWNNGGHYVPGVNAPRTLFQEERRVGWHPRMDFDDPIYRGTPATYDTWTTYYETDGVDQSNLDGDNDPRTGADEGTNGLDDPAYYDHDNDPTTPTILMTINGPDDPGERETSPPYPYPLKGLQVKIRVYEPESRQIRETTVTRNLAK